jgi:hypothetical protein
MREHDEHAPRRRHRRFGIPLRPARTLPEPDESRPFEVQQRDVTGPVRRLFFRREADALSFADALAHWMALRGERGSVQILWPDVRGPLGG